MKNNKRNVMLIAASFMIMVSLVMVSFTKTPILVEENENTRSNKIAQNPTDDKIVQDSGETTSTVTSNFSKIWTNVSDAPSVDSKNAKIAVDLNRNIHIVWEEEDDIKHRMFNYTAREFSGDIQSVAHEENPNGTNSMGDICVDPHNNNLHITWEEDRGGTDQISYRQYDIDADDWESKINVTDNEDSEGFGRPAIASNSTGGIAIIFQTYQLLGGGKLNITFFDGNTWSYENLHPNSTNNQREPDIYSYEDTWHITYQEEKDYIFHEYKSSNGEWNSTEVINHTDDLRFPEINIVNDTIYISWQHEISGTFHIHRNHKDLEGDWLSTPLNVSGDTGKLKNDQIYSSGVTNDGKYVVCYENDSQGLTYREYDDENKVGQGLITNDGDATAPRLIVNDRGSSYFVWDNSSNSEVHLRKLDGYGPNLQLHTISNGSIISGHKDLNSSVELSDIKSVNYTYSTDEGDSWIEIFSWERNTSKRFDEIDFETINYTWNTNGSDNRLDFENVLTSIEAIDVNGLDERIIFENITVDNYKPQISEFLNIYDELGNNYEEGDTNFTYHEGGAIYFEFNSYDNNSGSGTYAHLHNKTNGETSFIKANSSSDSIELTDSDIDDGTYDFYINTTDGAGNWNTSEIISNIRIDNTRPEIGFEEPVDKDEIRNGTIISINDESDDLKYINFSYYIENPDDQIYLGDISDPENGCSKEFEYDMEYENITIVANATDWAGLTGTAEVDVRVDNKKPEPELESPDLSEEDVGLTPRFNISLGLEQDNDTVWAAVEYDEQGQDD
ncbi:MAG: hypothetical protein R6U96_15560, partial [Promethearchaeia archaeon]